MTAAVDDDASLFTLLTAEPAAEEADDAFYRQIMRMFDDGPTESPERDHVAAVASERQHRRRVLAPDDAG